MVKQILLPIFAVMLFIVAVGVFGQRVSSLNLKSAVNSPNPSNLKTLNLEGKTIQIELANTAKLRSVGLSGRTALDEDRGMLFVFDSKKVTPNFWMKDMLIPIDIIWIRDGVVEKIDADLPPPPSKTKDSELKIYTPGRPIDYVLEVKAGFSEKYGVDVGDAVKLP
jgi:uncharacterized membrane protein (UPF0127 family)